MNRTRRTEQGQALILVVFGMIALIGITGLAIDGGNAYSDRRHAQNAADTAALATGLTLIRDNGVWDPAYAAGIDRALNNGYNNDLSSNWVWVYRCNDSSATCNLPPAEPFTDSNGNGQYDIGELYTDVNGNGRYDAYNPLDFVQVIITSHVPTYFAKVLGIGQMTNTVQSIVEAVPSYDIPWYNGDALVATMPGCKTSGWPNDPFTVTGGSITVVTGSGGVFVNSNCDKSGQYAFTSNSNSSISAVSGICVVGGDLSNGTVNPPVTHNCSQVDQQLYQLPSVGPGNCTTAAPAPFQIAPGVYVASPGTYNSVFPNIPTGSTLKLTKGIYCLKNGIALQGDTVTTDIDGIGTFDGSDGAEEGALLYVPSGSITFNGNSTVHLGAINKAGTPIGIKGYLIYQPASNTSTITLAGGNNSVFVGTILAPGALIKVAGASDGTSLDLQCQVIGYSINLVGSGGQGQGSLKISYSQGQVAEGTTNPQLQPWR